MAGCHNPVPRNAIFRRSCGTVAGVMRFQWGIRGMLAEAVFGAVERIYDAALRPEGWAGVPTIQPSPVRD